MGFNASDVMDESAALLNDRNKSIFNYDALLPYLRKAYDELSDEFTLNSIPHQKEVSTVTTVPAGNNTVGSPVDMIFPYSLEEKTVGSPDTEYASMKECDWEPHLTQTERLLYWNWREGVIYTPGSTQNRSVLIHYAKKLSVSNNTDALAADVMKTALAAKTAELAAVLIGGAKEKALYLMTDYERAKNRLLIIMTHSAQGIPIRRRPFCARTR